MQTPNEISMKLYFQELFNDTKITISGLNAVTTYRFQIFSENGVSQLSTKSSPEYADIVVTTEESIASSVTNVRVISVKSTEITLSWDAPSFGEGADVENDLVETYEVKNLRISFKQPVNAHFLFFILDTLLSKGWC